MKYSDQLADWLVELGYTHCFYVSGGNIMHLLESFSRKLDCRSVIHEVAAGIATEYFNETSDSGKALALVTAGPGLTNIVTAMAGAYLESRELLVIGGQVKTSDLAHGKVRQNGIQEIDGIKIVNSVCTHSERMVEPWSKEYFCTTVSHSYSGKKGPVFIEMPLDVQGRDIDFKDNIVKQSLNDLPVCDEKTLNQIVNEIQQASRPVIMLGGGLDRKTVKEIYSLFEQTSVPIVTTWNGADRLASDHPNFIGRPNTWGQRSANILLQQSDLLIALGTRLGMQQTGFNWQEFLPLGKIIQVDIDESELNKGHPEVSLALAVDANDLLTKLLSDELGDHNEWLDYCKEVRSLIPLVEENINSTNRDYVSPHKFLQKLSELSNVSDLIIPCSSGGAFTIMMQVFEQKLGQKIVTNKGLASMGYGLSGAIGASIANPDKRIILVEGDGGFAQNLQEIGTAAINNCNLKVFIFDDGGYASIRMTQRNYFGGSYVGCDTNTGLGLPSWETLFKAWDVNATRIDSESFKSLDFLTSFNEKGFTAFIVSIDPEQTYFPKISSRVADNGQMLSNPLHNMTPELSEPLKSKVFKFITME